VASGVNIASKSVTSAAEARLRQNSLHKASLRRASPEGKSSSSLELAFLTFDTPFPHRHARGSGHRERWIWGLQPWASAFAGATKKDAGRIGLVISWRP
jgi:hypothetical protein